MCGCKHKMFCSVAAKSKFNLMCVLALAFWQSETEQWAWSTPHYSHPSVTLIIARFSEAKWKHTEQNEQQRAANEAKKVSGRSLLRFVVSVFFSLSRALPPPFCYTLLDMSLVCNKIMASGSNILWSEEGCKKKLCVELRGGELVLLQKLAIEFNFPRSIKSIRISSGIKSWERIMCLRQAHASEFYVRCLNYRFTEIVSADALLHLIKYGWLDSSFKDGFCIPTVSFRLSTKR